VGGTTGEPVVRVDEEARVAETEARGVQVAAGSAAARLVLRWAPWRVRCPAPWRVMRWAPAMETRSTVKRLAPT
jgi:hypothetical protein